MSTNQAAELIANLTFSLLAKCQEKENWLAKKHGLLLAEFKCLRIFGTDERLNNKEIAKRLNLSQSRLTRVIDGLVRKGYMLRDINLNDRRQMRIKLSKRGIFLTKKLNEDFIDIHFDILQEIDLAQHESLITAMENLNYAVEKWLQKPA